MNRVIIRHLGARGDGVPAGGLPGQLLSTDGWVNAPSGTNALPKIGSISELNLVMYVKGGQGEGYADSGILIHSVASVVQLYGKQDKEFGKGLSENDFTNVLKAKLDSLTSDNFRGQYVTVLDLTTAIPAGVSGDYAFVGSGSGFVLYLWDSVGLSWIDMDSEDLSDQETVNLIYNSSDSVAWSKANNRVLTQSLYDQILGSASQSYVNSLALAAGLLSPAYGQMYYFDLSGTSIPIVAVSDGVSNLVKVDVISTLDAITTGFDSPVSSRIRYTGTQTQNFAIDLSLTFADAVNGLCVIALSKNGSPITASKVLVGADVSGTPRSMSNACIVSLSTNDYIEVLIGNTTDLGSPKVLSKIVKIEAV